MTTQRVLSVREQRASRLVRKRLDAITLRDLAAWGEYAAFCDAANHGALTRDAYEAREPHEWRRLKATLNVCSSERRVLILEHGEPRS